MMWLFAVLTVLVLAGIALVAAGHGSPMAPAYDDRPDAGIPEDGDLTAEHLRRVRFPLALRGYRMAEVDALLRRVADQLEAEPGRRDRRSSDAGGDRTGDVRDGPDRAAAGDDGADDAADDGDHGSA